MKNHHTTQGVIEGESFNRLLLALAGELESGDLSAAELPFYDGAVLQRCGRRCRRHSRAGSAAWRRGPREAGNLVERGQNGELRVLAGAYELANKD